MVRPLVLALLVSLFLAGSAGADGCPPSTCGGTSMSAIAPGSPLLVVRPEGTGGRLVAYDVVARKRRFVLPPGVLSANGRSFFTARTTGGDTTLASYDAHTGAQRRVWSIRGRFSLAAVSSTGRWLTLARYAPRRPVHVAIVGGVGGNLVHAFTLPSTNQLEAISPEGRRLYLVDYFDRRSSLRYRLQYYDLGAGKLHPNPPRDSEARKMTGYPQNAVASQNGRWLLTVYANPAKRYAFVHALDLRTGIAHCIDLPNAFDAGGAYALALSRDERSLWVADAAAGFVQTISLRKLRVTHVARFPRAGAAGRANAAASPDGRSLAFTTGSNVWVVNNGVVGEPHALRRNVDGIGFTPDGRHVLALLGGRFVSVR
jgi:hypothetical protein